MVAIQDKDGSWEHLKIICPQQDLLSSCPIAQSVRETGTQLQTAELEQSTGGKLFLEHIFPLL